MRIDGIRLLEKRGGKSGNYRAADHPERKPQDKSKDEPKE
jgi:hypothetical protein